MTSRHYSFGKATIASDGCAGIELGSDECLSLPLRSAGFSKDPHHMGVWLREETEVLIMYLFRSCSLSGQNHDIDMMSHPVLITIHSSICSGLLTSGKEGHGQNYSKTLIWSLSPSHVEIRYYKRHRSA